MKRRIFVVILAILLCTFVAGRLFARAAAKDFGRSLYNAQALLSRDGFADTEGLRSYLATPRMAGDRNRARILAGFGGGYIERLNELEIGTGYFSEQMSLPVSRRFEDPPKLQYFRIDSGDGSDDAVIRGTLRLSKSYLDQI